MDIEEIESKIVWGGLYRVKHSRWDDKVIGNDQIYYQAVPVRKSDGSIWMQDTHQIRSSGLKDGSSTLAAMDYIFSLDDPKIGDWCISKSKGDWYHKGNEKLEFVGMLDDYELICDLHNYRPLKKSEDYRHYQSTDIIHYIHLYQEHGYNWDRGDIGVILISKAAQPLLKLEFRSSIQDVKSQIQYPRAFCSKFDEMLKNYEKCLNEGIPISLKDLHEFELTKYLVTRIREMDDEIHQYLEDNRFKTHYTFEDTGVLLACIHPDIERYLEYGCHCPGEIYDKSGRYFEIYYSSNLCKLIAKSDTRTAAIARSDDVSFPQILIFWHDDAKDASKIIDSQRVDATENNTQLVIKYVNENLDHIEEKLDEFSNDDEYLDIDKYIESLPEV